MIAQVLIREVREDPNLHNVQINNYLPRLSVTRQAQVLANMG